MELLPPHTQRLLRGQTFAKRNPYTNMQHAQRHFYTQKFCARRRIDTEAVTRKTLLNTNAVIQRSLYKEELSHTHTNTFTQRKLLHRKDFTQGIQKFGHRNAFTRRSSYTQPLGPASTSVLKGVCSIQKPLAKNQEPQSQESMEKVFGTNC